MTAAPHPQGVLLPITARAIVCMSVAMVVIAISATTIALTGLAHEARRTLGFGFAGLEHSPAEVARVALHNARIAGGTLLCAALAPRLCRRARQLVTFMLATLLGISTLLVGIAVGAYGTRAITGLAAHLPFEFAAFALTGGAYLQACHQALRPRELTATAAASAALLIVAATLETYVPVGAAR